MSFILVMAHFARLKLKFHNKPNEQCIIFCTASYFIYGEKGSTPLSVDIEARMVPFWSSLINLLNAKLSFTLYSIMLTLLSNFMYATNRNSNIFYG